MKLQVLQENLNKAIGIASRFTSNRAQLPILGNILLSANKNKLTVSSTNLEISVSMSMGAKIEKEGEIGVPSRVFTELISNLPQETLTLEAEKEQLKISTPSFSSNVLGMNTSDFPKIPSRVVKEKGIVFPKEDFSKALSKVLFASSIDETRPILTGVLMILEKGSLTLVATDGFRLSFNKIKLQEIKEGPRMVLPKNVLSEIGRVDEGEEIVLELREKEKQVVFGMGDTILSSRLLEGEFPDFEKIIPKTSVYKISVDKEDLLRAVKLSAPFARDNANIVKIKTLKDSIKLFAESSQAGSQETKVEAKVEPGEFEIAFNYKFLEDFLGSAGGEEIRMEFSDIDKPGVFLDPSTPDYLHLIMPVKIQG
jgi:DNA polymerase-3 subunit beta